MDGTTRRYLAIALFAVGVATASAIVAGVGSADGVGGASTDGVGGASTDGVGGTSTDGTGQACDDERTHSDSAHDTHDTPSSTSTILVVADADTGDRVLERPVGPGTEVTLAYTHSVEQTDVRDVYVVEDDALRMVRMEFDAFGAGLPAGADVERTDDGLVASVDRSFETVPVVPGSIAGHELVVGSACFDLVALAGGEPVVLFVDAEGVRSSSDHRSDGEQR